MHCVKCGASVTDGATFCSACGNPVTANGNPATRNQAAPTGVAVPNYMFGAILTTLFCCLVGGIVAIIYSAQVNTKLAQGDIEGAKAASRTARGWIIANLVLGLLSVLLSVTVVALPNFFKYRQESQAAACISNMKAIQSAAECWHTEHLMSVPTMRDLCGPNGYLREEPTCPTDGSHYTISRDDNGVFNVKCGSGEPGHVLRDHPTSW